MHDFKLTVKVHEDRILLTPNRSTKDAGDIYHSPDLTDNDLCITPSLEDGWLYLINRATNKAGLFNGYGFSNVEKLMNAQTVIIEMKSISDHYSEYDFNI